MPKLKTTLATGVEPAEGYTYKIGNIEEVKTQVQGFSGVRVELEPTKRKEGDENKYATMLWMRDTAGVASKLGSFIAAFMDFLKDEDLAIDTDNWKGHVVRFVSWQPRKREVEVVE